jgi:imidazole glycerol phosphate synthase subunit HisF
MKKKLIKISIGLVLSYALCQKAISLMPIGGVIGNIEKYEFYLKEDSLKVILNNLYIKNPELIKTDTTMYGNNDGRDFYFMDKNNRDTTVFLCHVIAYPESGRKSIDLSLTTAANWGEMMDLAPNMGFWKQRGFRCTFEDKILSKVKEEVEKRKVVK